MAVPPSAAFGVLGRFFGNTISEAAAFAAGVAIGPVLGPPTQALRNTVNSAYPLVPPPALTMAQGVAQGQVPKADAYTWAKEQGYGTAQMDALVAVYDTGPGAATAFELRRRGLISDAEFVTALKREGIEDVWIPHLRSLLRILLSPAELANAVVQGHRSFAAALADAELQGYTQADFQTMVDNTGLPPGPETGLDWLRRGILTDAEFDQLVLEGHTKPKYIPFYHRARTQILSAAEWATARLRGHATPAESYAGGAAQGYDQAAMDMLFLNRGRPATARQIRIGYARGARVEGFTGDVDAAIDVGTELSDIRPEYRPIERAASYTLPSPFVLRGLTASGAFTEAQAETILLQSGWLPEYAKSAAAFFAKGTTAKGQGETQAELADEYGDGFITETEYRQHLTALGLTGHEQDLEVLHAEHSAIKSARTAAITKVRKQYEDGGIDETAFRGKLAAIGLHTLVIEREVLYANVVKA